MNDRLLRIGVVVCGVIIIDKTLKHGESAAIGSGDDAVIPVEDFIPADKPELFLAKEDGSYAIRFDPSVMSGWIQQNREERQNLESFAKNRPDLAIIPIEETTRGVVKIGGTTVLFHFVDRACPTS